jgi:hypothetical protein
MGITRPTGEQLRFRSQYTGDHILDTYLESSEKGNRQLSDLLDDLFDSNGTFRSGNFEFRFDASSDKIQFRAGNFASSTTGWTDITTFFNITGAFNASTTYNNFDVVTLTDKDVYIVHGLSSGTTFASEAAFEASANTEKLVDVSEAREWASQTTGIVRSTDYSAKAYAIGGTGVDTGNGSAKDWAVKTSGTVGNTGEYSAKYWATSTAVTTVSSGIANINTVAGDIVNVNTVASDITNVNTTATNIADVNTVATEINNNNLQTVAADIQAVIAVANDLNEATSEIDTVANSIANVDTVGTNIADVNTVADDLNEPVSEINTVATNITNVNKVGAIDTNVTTVANNDANITTVAGIDGNVTTVAGISADVTTVAGQISPTNNIGTLAGINADITSVAGISANVTTVAGISANVTTVADISADVTTTATNNANITTVAGISSNVTTVAGISSDVTTVAGISADVTTAATNVVAFNNTYLGASATAPTADPDGSALDLGDLYFDTSTNTMKVYSSSGWGNAGSSINATADRFIYTATAAQATFSGNDANGNALVYDLGFLDVYMNGVKLVNGSDFTATSGTSIVLASGAALNDTIEIIAYGTFTLSNQSINDMTDVTTGGITNGQFLQWNSTNSQFEPATVSNALTYSDLMPIEVLHPAQFTIPRGWWDTGERLLTGAAERYIISNWNVEADLLADTIDGVWYNITELFTDTGGTAAVSAPGDVVRNMSDQASGGRDVTGDNGLYATVPRPAIYSNTASSTLTVNLPYLGNNCTIGYSTDQGVTILTGQTVGGPTEILINRYLFGYVIIDEPISVEQTARLTQYLTALRSGYVAPTEYDGALLLEAGDALLLENDDRLDLEGVVSWPLNTTA